MKIFLCACLLLAVPAAQSGHSESLVNLARLDGVTCVASSEFHTGNYRCINAFDGNLDPGDFPSEWATNDQRSGSNITINFPELVTIDHVIIWPRCYHGDQNTETKFETAKGSFSVQRTCNGGDYWNYCDNGPADPPVKFPSGHDTIFLKITLLGACVPEWSGHYGIREIEIFGTPHPLVNLAMEPDVSCQVSSTLSADYTCENAFDGISDTTVPQSEWVSNGQVGSAYITIAFNKVVQIERIVLWPRCDRRDQPTEFLIRLAKRVVERIENTCGAGNSYDDCSSTEPNPELTFPGMNTYTTFVKVIMIGRCDNKGPNHYGLREIEIWGRTVK